MPSKIKVCQYVPHGAIPDKRGFAPAIVAQNYARYIDKEKIDIYFIANRENDPLSHEYTEVGEVFRIQESRPYRRLFRKITKLDPYPLHVRAAKIINQHPVDIVHVHQLEFPVADFRKQLQNRSENTKIAIEAPVTVNRFKEHLGVADRYIAVSEHVRNILIEKGYPEERIVTITNGVNTDIFKPLDDTVHLKQKYQIARSDVVVSFIGRKQEGKRFDLFLSLADYLLEKYSNITVLAVGPEPEDAKTEKTYEQRQKVRQKLLKHQKYRELPSQEHSILAEIFQMTDISVLMSLDEAQGMTMVESIASGCVTVSSAVGGIKETITDGYNGFLLPENASFETVIETVEEVLNTLDSDKMKSIRLNARKVAIEKFDIHVIADKLEKLYQDMKNE